MATLSSEMSLRALFNDFYKPRKLRSAAKNTSLQYGFTIQRLQDFIGREPLLSDLDEDTLARFLTWRREGGVAAPTANKDRTQLLALAGFAAKRGIIVLPDVEKEREPERIPVAWTADELDRLFKACSAQSGWIAGVPASLWWKGIHLVCWDSGERIGAIRQIRWDWIDMQTGWLIVRAESRKHKTRDKAFKLHPDTVAVLRAIFYPTRELVFPWPYFHSYLWIKYKGILEKAGLPCDRRSKFHRMRRSVASHAAAAGMDASILLDHSDRRVTEKYIDPTIASKIQPSERLFRPGSPTGD